MITTLYSIDVNNELEELWTNCDCLCIMKGESTRLLVNTASSTDLSSSIRQKRISYFPLKHLYLPSKAAILILFWTVIVGLIYHATLDFTAVLIAVNTRNYTGILTYDILSYATLALVMIFYPLSGFIADVCCGRLKTVKISIIVLLIFIVLVTITVMVSKTMHHYDVYSFTHNQGIIVVILASLSLLVFIIGLVGYQANVIQLGIDQLFEAPSQYLGLFIHYATWIFHIGSLSSVVVLPQLICVNLRKSTRLALYIVLAIVLLISIVVILISHWKHGWFHSEPGRQNPYKTVYNVLKYARYHKYPLRRSAFTYSDNYIPSRLDFAKERYGGPFSTEQVENVKTFLRILLMLSALGPAFALEVPASTFIFPLFGIHILHHFKHGLGSQQCDSGVLWELHVGSSSLMTIVSTVFLFPGYIWIVFSLLHKKVPKLFTRLGIGVTFCLLGVVSLLVIDTVGHAVNRESVTNYTQCMFRAVPYSPIYPNLDMHWAVLLPPNLLLGIGPLLVIATTLEFISAQSPQSMKGLLVGVFFAIKGLFQFLNSIVIIPLSLKQPWASREMIEHPPVTNCGFVYLLLTSVTGLIGLILFSLVAKRYKYRTRDEGMFRQQDVEEIYDRYITQNQPDSLISD